MRSSGARHRTIDALLEEGGTDVWSVTVDTHYDATRISAWRALLSPPELARLERFSAPHARIDYLVTRVLVRTVLAGYSGIAAPALDFRSNAWGRPELVRPAELRFNLSTTDGLSVCAVTVGRDVGIDVEATDRHVAATALAEAAFAPSEIRVLRALPPELQRDRFFDYWTLKEAYVKARGMGVAIPLNQFAFEIGARGAAGIRIDPRLGDDDGAWDFLLASPTPRHRLALAVRGSCAPVRFFHATLPGE